MAVDTQRPIARIRESLEVAGFDRLVTRVFFAVLPTGQSALKAIFDNLVSDLYIFENVQFSFCQHKTVYWLEGRYGGFWSSDRGLVSVCLYSISSVSSG